MIAEALVAVNLLKDKGVALAQGKAEGFDDRQPLPDYLLMQLRIRRESYVFLLHHGVDESRAMMVLVVDLLINADGKRCRKQMAN